MEAAATQFLWNPRRRTLDGYRPSRAPLHFHSRLPAYRHTRLVHLDALAAELSLERLWVKDESSRFGMPAFKVLGVSWAVYRTLVDRLGTEPTWNTLDDLRDAFAPLKPLCLVAATTGNHGRALARIASLLGLEARVFVPGQAPPDRVAAIRAEGADVVDCGDSYDVAVEQAGDWVGSRGPGRAILISDTAPTEVDRVSEYISEGYSTLFWEIEDQLSAAGEPPPETVMVQIGAGSLALTAATQFRRTALTSRPTLIGIEARSAASFQASARAGSFQTAPGPFESRMSCLNVGVPSRSSIDRVLAAFDAFVAIADDGLGPASRALAQAGVVAGPTGAAALVGLRDALPLLPASARRRVLVINTEGAADPTGYGQALLL